MTIQIESADEIPSSSPMVGRATLAMALSITDSETPNATARMAHRRRGIGSPSSGRAIWGAAFIAGTKIM